MTTPAVETDMPTILKNGRALWLILQAGELRGLPMPFAIRAFNVGDDVTLQFHTHAEVVTWAEVLEVDVVGGIARGEWLEVDVEVCTTDRPVAS
jgi:hypothetical protein